MSWIDKYKVVRRAVLAIAIWMTWVSAEWATWFATGNSRNGMEIAAILAAVQAPVMAFTGMVFKVYVENKGEA
jgi:hypothetical protein